MQSSVLYNNPVQTQIGQDNKRLIDWLHGDVSRPSLWLPASPIVLLIFTGRFTTVSLLRYVNVLRHGLSEPVLFKNFEKKLMPECLSLAQFHWKVKPCSADYWQYYCMFSLLIGYSGFVLLVNMFILVPYVNLVVVF